MGLEALQPFPWLVSLIERLEKLKYRGSPACMTVDANVQKDDCQERATVFFLATEDVYFTLHRTPLAEAAKRAGYRVVIAGRDYGKFGELEARGFEVKRLAWKRGHVSPLRLMMELMEVRRVYKQTRPDLIHHINMKPSLMGSVASLGTRGPVIVNNLAGLGSVFASSGFLADVSKTTLKLAFRLVFSRKNSVTIVENRDDWRFLVEDVGIREDMVKLIRGVGVDTDLYVPSVEPSSKPVVVTMVSRMLRYKGVDVLVEAARQLRRRGLDISVRLVGDTDEDSKVAIPREQLRAWHREGAVEWMGYRDDILALWRESHIAVLPSYYREGIPRSLLEAAACGRPIITTDMPGCREIAIDGLNGILVRPKDPGQLAEAIERLANDPAGRKRMGKAGRVLVESQFSERIVIGQILDLYRSQTKIETTHPG